MRGIVARRIVGVVDQFVHAVGHQHDHLLQAGRVVCLSVGEGFVRRERAPRPGEALGNDRAAALPVFQIVDLGGDVGLDVGQAQDRIRATHVRAVGIAVGVRRLLDDGGVGLAVVFQKVLTAAPVELAELRPVPGARDRALIGRRQITAVLEIIVVEAALRRADEGAGRDIPPGVGRVIRLVGREIRDIERRLVARRRRILADVVVLGCAEPPTPVGIDPLLLRLAETRLDAAFPAYRAAGRILDALEEFVVADRAGVGEPVATAGRILPPDVLADRLEILRDRIGLVALRRRPRRGCQWRNRVRRDVGRMRGRNAEKLHREMPDGLENVDDVAGVARAACAGATAAATAAATARRAPIGRAAGLAVGQPGAALPDAVERVRHVGVDVAGDAGRVGQPGVHGRHIGHDADARGPAA